MAKKKSFPFSFSSYEEFAGYCRCLSKLELGNQVEVYLSGSGYSHYFPSCQKTNSTVVAMVIGLGPSGNYAYPEERKRILLGASQHNIGFWDMHGRDIEMNIDNRLPDTKGLYRYGYYANVDDVRIKRIIKSQAK